MRKTLKGWSLTEGRIPESWVTRHPPVSAVVEALEAIHAGLEDPFVILVAPKVGKVDENFCQAYAEENASYRCEIRLFGKTSEEYRQYNLMRPDEEGLMGHVEPHRPEFTAGYDPDLATTLTVFMAFIRNPTLLPGLPGWQWLDITAELEAEALINEHE